MQQALVQAEAGEPWAYLIKDWLIKDWSNNSCLELLDQKCTLERRAAFSLINH